MQKTISNFRSAEIVEVMKVTVAEGNGTQDDPVSEVVYWLTLEGASIGTWDLRKRKVGAGKSKSD